MHFRYQAPFPYDPPKTDLEHAIDERLHKVAIFFLEHGENPYEATHDPIHPLFLRITRDTWWDVYPQEVRNAFMTAFARPEFKRYINKDYLGAYLIEMINRNLTSFAHQILDIFKNAQIIPDDKVWETAYNCKWFSFVEAFFDNRAFLTPANNATTLTQWLSFAREFFNNPPHPGNATTYTAACLVLGETEDARRNIHIKQHPVVLSLAFRKKQYDILKELLQNGTPPFAFYEEIHGHTVRYYLFEEIIELKNAEHEVLIEPFIEAFINFKPANEQEEASLIACINTCLQHLVQHPITHSNATHKPIMIKAIKGLLAAGAVLSPSYAGSIPTTGDNDIDTALSSRKASKTRALSGLK